MGFEARYVLDVTDHVWTEVYSDHLKRWLHCDSCEEQLDCPLTYEVGWGKKLSYIFSFGHDEVVDTARRYTHKWSEVLARRQDVSEEWLEIIIKQINRGHWGQQNPERVALLMERAISERDELLRGHFVRNTEVKGRVSGSAEWKNHRNESGEKEEVPVSTASASTSTLLLVAEVLKHICRNLVVGCQSSECFNPFCFTGRTQSNHTAVSSDVNERAAHAVQVASTLSSVGFSSESLMLLLCPLTSTELHNFLWKNQPLLYLPLQDIPFTCNDESMPLLDISGHDNHGDNSQRCGLRKPFRIPNSGPMNDHSNGAGNQRKDGAFGMQLLGGKFLSISGQNLLLPTNVVLSFLVRFDQNKALEDKKEDAITVLAGRIGCFNPSSLIKFRVHWSSSKQQFSCELQIENEASETSVITASLLAFGQYTHVAIAQGESAIAMYINGTEVLMVAGACRVKKSVRTAPPLKVFGLNGERSGERCADVAAEAQSRYRVAQILMWGSDFFDGLQFAYEKTSNAHVLPSTVFGLLVGNANAKRRASQPTVTLELLPDEVVARMSGRKGAWIDSITLRTNFGRSITCGGNGGGGFDVPTPVDSAIRSISFKIGDHLTDASVFVLQVTSVKALESKSVQDLQQILPSSENSNRQIVISAALRYLGNIAQQPEESKFQRIRVSNKYFAANVGVLSSEVAKSFMNWCGFQEIVDHGDQFFTFQPSQLQGKPSSQRLAAEAYKRIHLLKNVGAQ